MSNQTILESFVVRASEELFSAYGVPIARLEAPFLEDPAEPVIFAGIIGFTGLDVRGTLVMAPSQGLLKLSEPVAGGYERDWVGELANQLLGRIKNQLLSCQIEIHITTPVVIKGQHLSPVPRRELAPVWFGGETVRLTVWFDIELAPGKQLVIGESEVFSEGDAVMF